MRRRSIQPLSVLTIRPTVDQIAFYMINLVCVVELCNHYIYIDNDSTNQATQMASSARFAFGSNWANFLRVLNNARIAQAEQSLRRMLNVDHLPGKRVLDVGSGSGLFSLAARRLGASVHSFDYDPESVACTKELRRRNDPLDDG